MHSPSRSDRGPAGSAARETLRAPRTRGTRCRSGPGPVCPRLSPHSRLAVAHRVAATTHTAQHITDAATYDTTHIRASARSIRASPHSHQHGAAAVSAPLRVPALWHTDIDRHPRTLLSLSLSHSWWLLFACTCTLLSQAQAYADCVMQHKHTHTHKRTHTRADTRTYTPNASLSASLPCLPSLLRQARQENHTHSTRRIDVGDI